MKRLMIYFLPIAFTMTMTACGGGSSDVVDSGTYEGTVEKVKPEESEIYVDHDGKELELYFTDSTKLMRGGQEVAFNKLKKDQKVSVKVEKIGKKLNPLKVEILNKQ